MENQDETLQSLSSSLMFNLKTFLTAKSFDKVTTQKNYLLEASKNNTLKTEDMVIKLKPIDINDEEISRSNDCFIDWQDMIKKANSYTLSEDEHNLLKHIESSYEVLKNKIKLYEETKKL